MGDDKNKNIATIIKEAIGGKKHIGLDDLNINDMLMIDAELSKENSMALSELERYLNIAIKNAGITNDVDAKIEIKRWQQFIADFKQVHALETTNLRQKLVDFSKFLIAHYPFEKAELLSDTYILSTTRVADPVITPPHTSASDMMTNVPPIEIQTKHNTDKQYISADEYLRNIKMMANSYSYVYDTDNSVNQCEIDALKLMGISLSQMSTAAAFRANKPEFNLSTVASISDMLKCQDQKDRQMIARYFENGVQTNLEVSENNITFKVNDKDKVPLFECNSNNLEDGNWKSITYTMTEEASKKYHTSVERNILIDFMAQQVANVAKHAMIGQNQTAVFVSIANPNTDDLIRSAFALLHNQVIPIFEPEALEQFKTRIEELRLKSNNSTISEAETKVLWQAELITNFKRIAGGDNEFARAMNLSEIDNKAATNHTIAQALQFVAQSYRELLTNPAAQFSPESKLMMSEHLYQSDAKAKSVVSMKESQPAIAEQQVNQKKMGVI